MSYVYLQYCLLSTQSAILAGLPNTATLTSHRRTCGSAPTSRALRFRSDHCKYITLIRFTKELVL